MARFPECTTAIRPRGYDKVFSTNWFMPMAQRKIGRGELTLRTMLSLEPATVTQRFYPAVFQQGETAFGKPINDGQHPHDFFMEIAALYDYGRRAWIGLLLRCAGRRSRHGASALTSIASPLRKILWQPWDIICKTQPTSPTTL